MNVAQVEDEDSEFVFTSTSNRYKGEWILDSGCSYHMCPIKEYFTSLKLVDGGSVLMGNNHACEKKGEGTVLLKLHDGTTRELHNVWFVPDLKNNLISLGVLESKGFKITLENGALKVSTGVLTVMRGERRKNLYFLQGNSVVGGAATVVDKGADTSKLWHMRLGHAGEKALQGLVKQGLLKGAKTCKIDFCEHCVLGKQTKVKFGTAVHQTKGILDYVHSDV